MIGIGAWAVRIEKGADPYGGGRDDQADARLAGRPGQRPAAGRGGRLSTNAVFSVSITCSRSAWPARSRPAPAAAGSCGPVITGTPAGTMWVSVARLLPG